MNPARPVCVLVVDGGRSGCRARLRAPGGDTAEASGRGLPYARGPRAVQDILRALDDTITRLPSGRADVAVAGLAGVQERLELAPALAHRLVDRTGARRVVVTGDLVTSYAGALGVGPGVVVAAGTGAVAFAVGPDGRTARADGWGYLLGDEGSGCWIGRAGLAAALAHLDGRGGSLALRLRAEAVFGSVEALPELVHATDTPSQLIARFAPEVAAAAHAGDRVAGELWVQAGRLLARSAAAAAGGVLDARAAVASYTGGLFAAGELLLDPLRAELERCAPRLKLRPPAGDALDGGELLATADPLPDGFGYVHTTGA